MTRQGGWESITTDSTSSSVPTWARSEVEPPADASLVSEDPSWLVQDDEESDAGAVPPASDADGGWIGSMDEGRSGQRRRRRRRRRYLVIFVILMLLLALILGVTLGVRKNDGDAARAATSTDDSTGPTSPTSPGSTLPPASVPIGSNAPTISPTALPTTAPSMTPPTPSPTTTPPTLFPTFEDFTPAPTAPRILESLHSVQWGYTVSDCAYATPEVTIMCSNGGQVIVEESSQDDCTNQSSSVAVCKRASLEQRNEEVLFTCRGVNANQMTATASIPSGTATQCDAEQSNGIFRVTYGGEALHYILLERFCLVAGEDDVAAFDGYDCLQGQAGKTNSGQAVCYSFDSCSASALCFPFYPLCGQESCNVPLTAVRVADRDNRDECIFGG